MGDGSRIERVTLVSLLQRDMSMSGTNHVLVLGFGLVLGVALVSTADSFFLSRE